MNSVKGKVAIVTGGGSGIGRATSVLLAEAGAAVVVSDINMASAEETKAIILSAGGKAIALSHDVTNEVDWTSVMQATIKEYDHLDILVNNAGISGAGLPTFEEATLASWQQVMSINLDAVFIGCQKAVLLMKDSGGGSIINLSSVMGLVGGAGAAYNASKGGVRLLTKSIAVHCGHQAYNIRVNSVHPGFINTPMVDHIMEVHTEEQLTRAEFKAMLVQRHPIGRLGEADDIAKGILFLASDDAAFITGSELVIDGGYTAV